MNPTVPAITLGEFAASVPHCSECSGRALRYVLDKKDSASFVGSEGYITDAVLRAHVPPPSDDSMILVCGPPPMMKAISGDKAKDKSQGAARLVGFPQA